MFCQYIVVVSVTFTNLCKHLILIVVLKRIERQNVNKMYKSLDITVSKLHKKMKICLSYIV